MRRGNLGKMQIISRDPHVSSANFLRMTIRRISRDPHVETVSLLRMTTLKAMTIIKLYHLLNVFAYLFYRIEFDLADTFFGYGISLTQII